MLVSIIITSYNYEAYLGEAIESALNQTYPDVEVIVVDDGSTDNSVEIINGYRDRVIPILKTNAGQCSCFNTGFDRCHGDSVLFLDADDVLRNNAVELHVARMKNPGVVKCSGYMEIIDAHGKPTGGFIPSKLGTAGDYCDVTLKYGLGSYRQSYTSGNIWSRTFLEKVMPLPENNLSAADGYLTSIDTLFGKIESVHEPVVSYRIHGKNMGPENFRFNAEYMRNRLRNRNHRTRFAEAWIAKLGYQCDTKEFRKLRDWRLVLMSYTLGLMGEPEGTPASLAELVASPFQRPDYRIIRSATVSVFLVLLGTLPRKMAIKIAQYMLENRKHNGPFH